MTNWLPRILGIGLLFCLVLLIYGYYEATSTPVARKANIITDNLPASDQPLRIILMADLQMAGPDMTPNRANEIVKQINKERADLILMAGDFISEKSLSTKFYSADETIAPLSKLEARLGVYAVLGNHDHWADEKGFIKALRKYQIPLLRNEAVRIGPVNLIGVDDEYTGRADIKITEKSLNQLSKAPNILFTHGPDIIPDISFKTDMILAGHTHCGQIRFPIIGAITYLSRYGNRFACGHIKEGDRNIFLTAGLGTSIIPMRIGTPPDYWVITLKGRGE